MPDKTPDKRLTARQFKSLLRKEWLELFQEYVDESEHQDGPAYWRQFPDVEQAMLDMIRFHQFKLEQYFNA